MSYKFKYVLCNHITKFILARNPILESSLPANKSHDFACDYRVTPCSGMICIPKKMLIRIRTQNGRRSSNTTFENIVILQTRIRDIDKSEFVRISTNLANQRYDIEKTNSYTIWHDCGDI